ncbi:MAG TPA: XdhC/CoxI family protein [Thermoanaerobaculia bacterium]|nr:XdhC/CoxI family protein [Thermoanaerobaculia bacterium]
MVAPPAAEVLAETERSLQRWGRVALCQIVRAEGSTPGKVGWKLLVRADGTVCGNLGGGAFEALVQTDAAAKLATGGASELKRYYLTEEATRGEATGMVCGGMAEVFLEIVESPPVLAVCGGGPVGQALARGGALAGFDLLVVEDRAEFRRPELFPDRTRFAEVGREFGEEFFDGVAGRELYVAVVSRCWETDVAALAGVLRQAPAGLRYLGLMGSRRKIERVREELAARGAELNGVPLRAPIGLPIGGDSPGEIAISILAEVIGVRHEAPPAHR